MEKATTSVQTAPLFEKVKTSGIAQSNPIPSSSPAFGTPAYPIRTSKPNERARPSILPIVLPPSALRPLAFRTFTKKHNLTITSSALQSLATFVGKHCGSGWKEEGLAEKVLDAAAKTWKKNGGGLIVAGEGDEFAKVLRQIEGSISGGRISEHSTLSRQSSFAFGASDTNSESTESPSLPRPLERHDSLGLSGLAVEDDENTSQEPRSWMKLVGAFDQPRLRYNILTKHFEPLPNQPSLLPNASHKTELFRQRYNLIQQILLRNESFQTSSVMAARTSSIHRSSSTLASTQQAYKLTPIGNLLGRSGSSHILLGLLTISPTGLLTLNDLTGSIALDITHARPAPEDGAWFTPGMIVLVDGMYEEEGSSLQGLDRNVGIGGSIGGKFTVFSIGGPPCERREVTLGVNASGVNGSQSAGGGFGWVDFLGTGSERATGSMMRRLEQKIFPISGTSSQGGGCGRMVVLGEVNLDDSNTLQALRKVLSQYDTERADQTPMVFVLMGNFSRHSVMSGSKRYGSMEYKESFDALASVLSDYPAILQNTTFVFVPGDNDPWASSFSAGAATAIPRDAVPTMFTNRIRKAFTSANSEAERSTGKKTDGEAIWTTNPARLSIFGPTHEIVLFRDDMSSRLQRNSIRFPALGKQSTSEADRETSTGTEEASSETQEDRNGAAGMEVDVAVETAESTVPISKAAPGPHTPPSPEVLRARKLVKTVLDQACLSPFPLSHRPVLWDYAGALQLYPLPTALVLMDPDSTPFAISYQGCQVLNPGPLTPPHRRKLVQWIEYDISSRQGITRDARL